MESLRLLLADDHELVRKGMRTILEAQAGWNVAAEANDGRQAVEKAKEVRPEIAVLDISMPVLNGLEAARQIAKTDLRTKILIVTLHESDRLVREVLDAGARGYVLKSDASRDLVAAVNALSSNKTYFTPKVAEMVMDGYLDRKGSRDSEDGGPVSRLTPRQREIAQLLAEGKSSKEVAVALGLSVKTAETHRANIMLRLNCHSISELACYAVRNNIIASSGPIGVLAYGIRCIPFPDAEWCPRKYAGKRALNPSPAQQIKLENPMNWDQIEGSWKQAMAKVKQKWAKLTDDDVLLIRGKRDQLVGKIQER